MRTSLTKVASLSVFAAMTAMAIGSASAAPAGPVCGIRADGPKTYDSARAAMADGAKVAHLGNCIFFCQGFAPTLVTQPMCGTDPLNHARVTYPNNCEAENARAIWVHDGPCKK
jgi:hypothetical protein